MNTESNKENKTWEERFDEKVTELKYAEIISNLESDRVCFGYRVQRGNELFKIVDFGNIKSFISQELQRQRKEIRDNILKIIQDSKPTFFVNDKNKDIEIPTDELLYEQKAEICTNVEMYFYQKLKKKE